MKARDVLYPSRQVTLRPSPQPEGAEHSPPLQERDQRKGGRGERGEIPSTGVDPCNVPVPGTRTRTRPASKHCLTEETPLDPTVPDPPAGESAPRPSKGRVNEAPPRFPEWPFHALACFVRRLTHIVVFFPILRFLNPLYVHGRENIDSEPGPYIFVANHSSHFDTPALMRAMPSEIRHRMTAAAAADYFFTSWIRGFIACLVCNAFPFPRKGRGGIDRARWLLDNGWHIMLYPEGTRSLDGTIKPFRPGVGVIAVESGATVVPVALLGMRRVLPKGRPLPRRASVELRIGPPMRFASTDDPIAVTRLIEETVRALAAPDGIELARGRVRKR